MMIKTLLKHSGLKHPDIGQREPAELPARGGFRWGVEVTANGLVRMRTGGQSRLETSAVVVM